MTFSTGFRRDKARASNSAGIVSLLKDSCNAFNRYEQLRHMSDRQLAARGLHRDEVCDALFTELYGHRKPPVAPS